MIKQKVHVRHMRRHEIRLTHKNMELLNAHECGGLTFAWTDEGETLRVAVARCHPKDRFVRATGSKVALQRLRDNCVTVLKKELAMLPWEGEFEKHEHTLERFAGCRPLWKNMMPAVTRRQGCNWK